MLLTSTSQLFMSLLVEYACFPTICCSVCQIYLCSYMRITALINTKNLLCTQTLRLGTALPQLVWRDVHFQTHIHILNHFRSKSEDKLLNPAASKLSACAGTTEAGFTALQESARCLQAERDFLLLFWSRLRNDILKRKCTLLFALFCH